MKVSNLMIVLIALVLYGCNNKPNNLSKELNNEEQMEIKAIMSISNKDGLSMLQTNCYSCHNPNSESHDNMLAPPLAGIKYKYKKLYKTEELFIAQMSDFIDKPTKENAVMKGPVRRF
ncbi:c-type cytochrome [Algibacter mikhailovii]|uniref:c-type cytochrome n=1 Tax=Algibacter mikhailovii TaxID=425498 RepID=UPI002494E056|nr:c-type cytochrome [Algibacter mikhailovii]